MLLIVNDRNTLEYARLDHGFEPLSGKTKGWHWYLLLCAEPRPGQTKDYYIGICCFVLSHGQVKPKTMTLVFVVLC